MIRMFYSRDGFFDSEDDIAFDQKLAEDVLTDILAEPIVGGFLGFVNPETGQTLQFAQEGEDEFIVDIPKPDLKGSLQGTTHFAVIAAVIENVERAIERAESLFKLDFIAFNESNDDEDQSVLIRSSEWEIEND